MPSTKKTDIWLIEDQFSANVVMDSASATRASDVRSAACDFLIASKQWDETRADEATDMASVVRAYWGGDDLGFVQLEHPEARPVWVINLNAIERR